ncbi:MAG: flavin reductase family protein [Acidimicrobiia bacterium]
MTTTFQAADLTWRDAYKLLNGLVTPRPIAWVGTRSADGIPNLAPYSFFNVASADPPTILFCPQLPEGRDPKDSLANVEATGEFTVSIVSRELAERMNATSEEVAPDVDEFALGGVLPKDGDLVDAPYVSEAPAAMECRLHEIIRVGAGAVVLGEVLAFHVDPRILDGTRVLPEELDVLGRLGGPNYTTTRDIFQMVRP